MPRGGRAPLGPLFMAQYAVEVANMALDLLGTRAIVSLDDQNKEARAAKRNYDQCRQEVLRDYPWNFATDRIVLDTPDATPPAFGFTNRFALPLGFMRVHTVYDGSGATMDPGTYTSEGGWLMSNESKLYLRYVFDLDDVTRFDPLFVKALAAHLAWTMAYLITASESRQKELHESYLALLRKAKFVDTVEEPSREFQDDVWIAARVGRGDFVRDPGT